MADGDIIQTLQLQLVSLQNRIKELESENSNLASRLSNCCCRHQVEGNTHENVGNGAVPMGPSKKLEHGGCKSRKKSLKGQIMHSHPKRYVALKIMYFGKRFYGFSDEAQMEPSVESELFKAFEETRLLISDRKESQYSRCGRTDKGVSAFGQVVALYLRSKIRGGSENASNSSGEIDYVRVLNRALPKDIRVLGCCHAPVDLHARFSCLSREYKYFFWRENLDLLAMENAGKKFLGEHDFRNFCKMDAVNVHTYKRRVLSFEMSPAERFGCKEIWIFKIRGSAFLWHQMRCMVSVLFMIGQGLETADVIDAMLDTEKMPRKPQYLLASESPLVLHSCEFNDLNFSTSPDAKEALRAQLHNELQNHLLEAAILGEALQSSSIVEGEMPPDERQGKKKPFHIPLKERVTEPSYEERRAKLNSGALKQRFESLKT